MCNTKPIPKKGEYYYFFDDGKISLGRCYKALVNRVLPSNYENKSVYDVVRNDKNVVNLFDVLKENVNNCRQSENFIVLNSPSHEVGQPYLYAEETDYFIECIIQEYDEDTIWFTRDVNGGWYALNIEDWQNGRLDIDFSLYKQLKKYYTEKNMDLDEILNREGMLI